MFKHISNVVACCAILCAAAFAADAFPHLAGQTLGERAVAIPDAFKGKQTVLVITFTRAAQDQARAWTDRIKQKSISAPTFQVLELEDVPRLMRGFVRGSIRRSIPKDSQDNFILLFEGEDALKKAAGFQVSDDAYVLLLDADGNVQWREHGVISDAKLTALQDELKKK